MWENFQGVPKLGGGGGGVRRHDLTNKKTMTMKKTKVMPKTMTMTKTKAFREHSQRATYETFDFSDI